MNALIESCTRKVSQRFINELVTSLKFLHLEEEWEEEKTPGSRRQGKERDD